MKLERETAYENPSSLGEFIISQSHTYGRYDPPRKGNTRTQ